MAKKPTYEELQQRVWKLQKEHVARRREQDKNKLEERVSLNVKGLIQPYLEKLRKSGLNERQESFAGILESNISDIVSPFSQRLSSNYLNFTPRELEVANLVKEGKITKEIADLLSLSNKTIEDHRKNLRSPLLSVQE